MIKYRYDIYDTVFVFVSGISVDKQKVSLIIIICSMGWFFFHNMKTIVIRIFIHFLKHHVYPTVVIAKLIPDECIDMYVINYNR